MFIFDKTQKYDTDLNPIIKKGGATVDKLVSKAGWWMAVIIGTVWITSLASESNYVKKDEFISYQQSQREFQNTIQKRFDKSDDKIDRLAESVNQLIGKIKK